MKGIQYMGKGIAKIMSHIGTNKEIIQHCTNGLLANSHKESIQCLNLLINDNQLRKNLEMQGGLQ